MSWATVTSAVAHLWGSRSRSVRLFLTGGEPLLEFEFVQQVVSLVRRGRHPARTATLGLLTNGTHLEEEQVTYLARHGVSVQLSFDGREPAQERRGYQTFEKLDGLLKHLRRHHPAWFQSHFSVAVTLVPETVPYLADSVKYLLDRGVPEVGISPARGAELSWNDGLVGVLDHQMAQVYRYAVEEHQRSGRIPVALFRRRDGPSAWRSAPLCAVDRGTMAVVDVDGNVYGCPSAVGSLLEPAAGLLGAASRSMRMGHVSDPHLGRCLDDFRRSLASTGLFGRRDLNYSSYRSCRECCFVSECQACPMAIAHAHGASDPHRVPDFTCAYNSTSLEYRLRFSRRPRSLAHQEGSHVGRIQ